MCVIVSVMIVSKDNEMRFSYCDVNSPEVGGTTGFGMPFNACGNCPAANAAIGLIYVPCAVAAAMSAACCCNKKNTHIKENILSCHYVRFTAALILYSYNNKKREKKVLLYWIEYRTSNFVTMSRSTI